MSLRIFIASVFTCLGLVAAFASARAEPPCAADVRTLCKDVPIGGGRIQACLKAHEAEVSETCRKTLDTLGREVKLLAAVCRWDIAQFCSDVNPGAARIVTCLKTNEAQLSPECKTQLRSMEK
jgi:hypothetical protein